MDEATEENTPRVWIGCLACYGEGQLTGDWFPAITAGDVTTRALHARAGVPVTDAGYPVGGDAWDSPHEELWVMDTDNMPGVGECSPAEAQLIAEMMGEIESQGYPVAAVVAFLDNEHETLATASDDVMERFEEAWNGEHDTFRDFADGLADEVIAAESMHTESTVVRYFNYDMFANDLLIGGDYWTEDAPGGRVYVFRSI